MKKFLFLSIITVCAMSSCLKEELAFDVIESPVKATFTPVEGPDGMVIVDASFVELDKSGILDKNIGIIETPISSLSLKVFIFEDDEVGSVTTDGQGQVRFEIADATLEGAPKLEWVGVHNDVAFRIYYRL